MTVWTGEGSHRRFLEAGRFSPAPGRKLGGPLSPRTPANQPRKAIVGPALEVELLQEYKSNNHGGWI
jgi:hypothetical protein